MGPTRLDPEDIRRHVETSKQLTEKADDLLQRVQWEIDALGAQLRKSARQIAESQDLLAGDSLPAISDTERPD